MSRLMDLRSCRSPRARALSKWRRRHCRRRRRCTSSLATDRNSGAARNRNRRLPFPPPPLLGPERESRTPGRQFRFQRQSRFLFQLGRPSGARGAGQCRLRAVPTLERARARFQPSAAHLASVQRVGRNRSYAPPPANLQRPVLPLQSAAPSALCDLCACERANGRSAPLCAPNSRPKHLRIARARFAPPNVCAREKVCAAQISLDLAVGVARVALANTIKCTVSEPGQASAHSARRCYARPLPPRERGNTLRQLVGSSSAGRAKLAICPLRGLFSLEVDAFKACKRSPPSDCRPAPVGAQFNLSISPLAPSARARLPPAACSGQEGGHLVQTAIVGPIASNAHVTLLAPFTSPGVLLQRARLMLERS